MSEIKTFFTRNKNVESIHSSKCLIINSSNEIIFSTKNDLDIVFPRSAIKIFQAIPFAESGAIEKFGLNKKQIALSCSSHVGEGFHLKELLIWFKKLSIPLKHLKCGIHNPIDQSSSNKLLLSGNKPTQIHNNCAGKHLAMLSSCIANSYNIKSYLDFDHPHQKKIRESIEYFSEKKIKKNNFAIDGCSAPQYGLKIKHLAKAMINLKDSIKDKSNITNILVDAVLKNPKFIGGTNNLDSNLIKISDKQIFCKGGAEGVFLFVNLKTGIAGVIKINDGNERALPSIVYNLFNKFGIISKSKNQHLKKWHKNNLKNHAGKKIGNIFTEIN
tara:strand:+ start:2100 stop:3086 length:987 start_codon:yes stop_codon:yes gene_type:complete